MKRWCVALLVAIVLLAHSFLPTLAADDGWFAQIELQIQELTRRIEVLESQVSSESDLPSDGLPTFTGQGNTQTFPFTVSEAPWKLDWRTDMKVAGGTTFNIFVHDPSKSSVGRKNQITGYGFYISGGIQTGEVVSYLPANDYYLRIDTGSYVTWEIWIR